MPKFIKIRGSFINVDQIVAIEANWESEVIIALTHGHLIKYRGTPKQLADDISNAKTLDELVGGTK